MKRTPNIRFKGFDGEWEEKKAGDIFESFVEKNHPELPVLSATQDKGMITREDIGYSIAHNERNEATYKRVLPGQFVIHLRSFQGGFAHSAVEGITSPAYDVFGFKDSNAHSDWFWKYIFCSKSFIKRLVTVTYGIRDGRNVSYPEFLGLSFCIPKKNEQIHIAQFQSQIDTLISQRTKEVEKMRNIKRALLEKMFPQTGQSVPQIRFKEFTGDWEEKKVMDIANRVTRKNSNLESKLPLCISAQLGLVSQLEYYNNTVVGSNIANYFLIRKGEFAYNKSAAGEFPMGAIKRLDKHDCGILSTLYIAFALKPNVDSDYIVAHYETKPWQCDVKKRIAVGARNHGLLNISPNDFMESLVVTPKTKEEQSKVGKLFAYLDSTIAARDRQITLLKNLKLALLEQMFVNN